MSVGEDNQYQVSQVKLGFTVKASDTLAASTTDLAKIKHKGSVTSITKAVSTIGGSLASIGTKEKKNIKALAKSGGSSR